MRIDRNLSYSQLKSWIDCREQWGFKYRSGYRPNEPKIEFTRGTLIHMGMEQRLLHDLGRGSAVQTWWQLAKQDWHAEWDEIMGDDMVVSPDWFENCKFVVEKAVEEFHKEWEVVCDGEGPMLERRMYAALPAWYRGLVFINDVVARRKVDPFKGGIFSLDFKTFGKQKDEGYGDYDLQGAIYQRGLVECGIDAIGSCLFQIPQEPPKTPRINNDGTENKTDVRTRDNWRPVLDAPQTFRSPEFLDNIWNRIVLPSAQQMYWAEIGGVDLTPAMDYYTCKFCEFKDVCQARLKGHDADAILAEKFTQRYRR